MTCVVGRHDPPIGCDEIVTSDKARYRRELAASEENSERGLHKGDRVDDGHVQRSRQREHRQNEDHGAASSIGEQHHLLAVNAVDECPEQQAEQQVRHELRSCRYREVRRRMGQFEDEQRQCEESEGTAHLRDELAGEVQPEVAPE